MSKSDFGGAPAARPVRAPRLRLALLKSSAITGGVLTVLIAAQQNALASCTVEKDPNTVVCDSTTTTNTANTDAFAGTSNDKVQRFDAFGGVIGSVNAGATVNGFALSIVNQQSGADGNITFTNSGTAHGQRLIAARHIR